MAKLCLFDASGYIHRAFHAIPPLSTTQGEPVNAVYGFARMISKVLKEERPDYVGVCFDSAAPTFRHEQFEEYKGTRAEIDTSLVSQLPLAEELALMWGLPCVKMDGFEADDLIATLTRLGRENDLEVLILSGDKDILQLVGPGVCVRDEIRRIDFDDAKVKDRHGVGPSQLVDLLSLTGDKIDNVPGVPGVGEKTAARLLIDHGSLEGIFAGLDRETPSLREKLAAHRANVFRNRELIALRTDAPIGFSLDRLKPQKPDEQTLPALLERLEFRGGLYGVDDSFYRPAGTANVERKTRTVLTREDLAALKAALNGATAVSFDVETDSLNTRTCALVGFSVAVREGEGWYVPVGHRYVGAPSQVSVGEALKVIAPVLESETVLKIAHNFKFDNAVLACVGQEVKGPVFDTMIAAYCIDPSRMSFGLKDLAVELLGERMTRIGELIGKGKAEDFGVVPVEAAAPYAAADAEVTLRLHGLLSKRLAENGVETLYNDLEMPLVRILQDMEAAGIAIDADRLRDVGRTFDNQRQGLEEEIYTLAGERFTLNSPKQLGRILFEKLQLPATKKTKTGYSTDEEVLRKLAASHPICEKIIACRELAKLSSTYVQALLSAADAKTGRVHTTFNQTGASTGRLSSTDPNLQNIPIRSENGRLIRQAFIAPSGSTLVSADYSQIDLRCLAHMSEDPVLIRTFEAGGDVHQATAAEIFHVPASEVTTEMRRSAKAINFGIVYGQQAFALSQAIGVDIKVAREFIEKYFARLAGVRAWIESTLADARTKGYVTTLAGRRRPVPDINSANAFQRGFAERVATNTPIQGSSADLIKFAMIRVHADLKNARLKTRMLVQVHDELLFEVPDAEMSQAIPIVQRAMEEAYRLKVPLVADIKIGRNWNDMKKLEAAAAR